ncbi:MAG: hypothetical protein DRH07_06410 [Deltaproteobacteria bacterium]|nr:MAG: hypothetical protein DRH07_06410 [Deltaproteobacteria bacterium]
MARTKIDYGIDLGTTNSAIARMDEGENRIIKSDDGQSDTTPSCVAFNKKQTCFIGLKAFNRVSDESAKAFNQFSRSGKYKKEKNAYIEFKRSMGSDKKYESSFMEHDFSSEELSAEVLKKLKSYVRDDSEITAVVVTVPAMFQQNQIEATKGAAELAGFQYCELLQEPIAAAMAYGLSTQGADGFWLVFDFGGGTFDAALMRVEEGIIKVEDTSGDNRLGGKNLDHAIVDEILIPHLESEYNLEETLESERGRELLREALKRPAEEIKIEFSSGKSKVDYLIEDLGEDDDGEEFELNITATVETFEEVVKPIFQQAVDISIELLKRNNLSGSDLFAVLMVGGPTFLETLRSMLREQITDKIDVSIDPMTVVAKGAALFASTRDIPEGLQVRDRANIQLKLKYPETTVETEENLGIKVERDKTEGEVPGTVFVEINRKDKGWSSGKIEIVDDAEIIEIELLPGKANGFTVTLFDNQGTIFPCEPAAFTIIQGMKVSSATLPLNMCAEALDTNRAKALIVPFKGLEKNTSLPAKGKQTFRTQTDLRPGNRDDLFEIRLYEAEEPYSRALPNEWIGTISITGEDLPQFLPKDSEVEITLEMDASRIMKCSCYFPYLDESVDKESPSRKQEEIPTEKLESDIEKTRHSLSLLFDDGGLEGSDIDDLETKLAEVSKLLDQGRNDRDRKNEVASRIGELIKKIDKLNDQNQWPAAEQELDDAFAMVTVTQQRLGDEKTTQAIEQMRQQAVVIKETEDTGQARLMADALRSLDYHMVKEDIGFWAGFIVSFDRDFDTCEWKDKAKARRLVDEGKEVLATAPSKAKLEDIVRSLFELMPDKSEPIGNVDLSLLKH